jgi:hypothetical protein
MNVFLAHKETFIQYLYSCSSSFSVLLFRSCYYKIEREVAFHVTVILILVLFMMKIVCLHGLRVFENRVMSIFESEREEMTGGCR